MNIVKVVQYTYSKRFFSFCVVPYGDTLVSFEIEQSSPTNQRKVFNFIKTQHDTKGRLSFHLERCVEVKSNSIFLRDSIIFVFDSLELKKPVIALLNSIHKCPDGIQYEIYDFDSLELLARGEVGDVDLPTPQTRLNNKCMIWRRQYLVDNCLRILQLQPNDDKNGLPFKIHWYGGIEDKQKAVFNMGDTYLLSTRYDPGLNQDTRFLYQWNDNSRSFDPSPIRSLKANLTHQPYAASSAYYIRNKIVVALNVDPFDVGTRIVLIWNTDGTLEQSHTRQGKIFQWQDKLVEVYHKPLTEEEEEMYQEQEEIPPTLKFWNISGELVHAVEMNWCISDFVWNSYLIKHENTHVEVYRMSTWRVERLMWLAFLKNKGTSPLSLLPKEVVKLIIDEIRFSPEVVADPTTTRVEKKAKPKPRKEKLIGKTKSEPANQK